jgi:hypothetical protein
MELFDDGQIFRNMLKNLYEDNCRSMNGMHALDRLGKRIAHEVIAWGAFSCLFERFFGKIDPKIKMGRMASAVKKRC